MPLIRALWKNYVHTSQCMNRIYLLFFVSAVLLAACAQQITPTGGEKDTSPPKILKSIPTDKALNYKGKGWFFEFDEYVNVSGAQKELIVTPPLKYPVDFNLRGKGLSIEWRDTLLDQTTYLFQFGDGIVDVNEGNPLDSNIFVFSTGDYLDSFYMEGKVIDALTLKPVEDVWVMLYVQNDDSLPYKELPRYFAKTDESGSYRLNYLAKGDYKVFALKPVNGGYLYDQPDESIAFLERMFAANSPMDSTAIALPELRLFAEEDTLQYLADYEQIQNRGLTFKFNQPAEELQINEINGQNIADWDSVWSDRRDSLAFWFPAPWDYDSLHLEVVTAAFRDTVYLRKPQQRNKGKARGKQDEVEQLALSVPSTSKVLHFKPFVLSSETPLAEVDWSDALLVEAGDTMELATYVGLEDSKVIIDYPWKQGEKYKIFIPDSALTDRFGLTNDTLNYALMASKDEEFGSFQLNFQLPDSGHAYLIQLQKSDGKALQEDLVSAKGSLVYSHLKTGSYKLKLFFDQNNNGKWDTGNYLKHDQPERVAFYDQTIELRSNWITEIDWLFTDGLLDGSSEEQEPENESKEKR